VRLILAQSLESIRSFADFINARAGVVLFSTLDLTSMRVATVALPRSILQSLEE
jgi:hypothetical protein